MDIKIIEFANLQSILMAKKKAIKNYVIKSNSLIEARYRLSLQESHVVLWLLTQIKPDDEDFKPHTMKISEFSRMIGVEADNQYSKLRFVTRSLMRRVLEIYDSEQQEWLQIAWLSSTRYQQKKGSIVLKFDPGLKPYLLHLKNQFTKIDIVDTLKLKSVYAVRLFELLCQYEPLGKRKISIDDLRSWCSIESNEYGLYSDLKRYVINKAKTEINAKTNYEIDYKEIKESRKVVSIEWTIQKKTFFEKHQQEKAQIISQELRSKRALMEQMMEYGFSKQAASRILNNTEELYVANALKAVDLQVQRGRVRNPKAMLLTAIQEKWHPEKYKAAKAAA